MSEFRSVLARYGFAFARRRFQYGGPGLERYSCRNHALRSAECLVPFPPSCGRYSNDFASVGTGIECQNLRFLSLAAWGGVDSLEGKILSRRSTTASICLPARWFPGPC